ncbi:MAG: PEP-CTERM sorting domain-containing protein [Halioglobus sp.]
MGAKAALVDCQISLHLLKDSRIQVWTETQLFLQAVVFISGFFRWRASCILLCKFDIQASPERLRWSQTENMPMALKNTFGLILGLALLISSSTSTAGVIYIDRAAFLAALTTPLLGGEDFEGFPLGVAANPLLIVGGGAEVLNGGATSDIVSVPNLVGGATPTQAWLSNLGGAGPVGIQGPAAAPIGIGAIGMDFGNEFDDVWTFVTSLGAFDVSIVAPTSTSFALDKFVGWIGAPGESLNLAFFGSGGLLLDNIVGYGVAEAVPVPASFALLCIGLLGITAVRRRRI